MSTVVQEEEIGALRAIYDQDFVQAEGAETSFFIRICDSDDTALSLELNISLPVDYPDNSPPIYQLKNAAWMSSTQREHIAKNFQSIFSDGKGEVVVYQWVEWLRDYIKKQEDTGGTAEPLQSPKKSNDVTQSSDGSGASLKTTEPVVLETSDEGSYVEIVHGEPLTDRKSTFQAHVAEVHSPDEVKAMLSQLKSNKKIAAATHNILAYRIYVSSREAFLQDCDDDGETAAGGRLLHLLQIMDAQNVAVVVTRWYGGILLHADRFKHINNVARIAIQDSGLGLKHLDSKKPQDKNSKKKRTKSKS